MENQNNQVDIHAALIQLGFEKLVFKPKKSGNEYKVALEDLPIATLRKAIDYGLKRLFQDRTNTRIHRDPKANPKTIEEAVIADMLSGKIATTAKRASSKSELELRIEKLAIAKMAKEGVVAKSIREQLKEHELHEVVAAFIEQRFNESLEKAKPRAQAFLSKIRELAEQQLVAEREEIAL